MDNNINISDQQFSEIQDMVQSGGGSVAETTTTIIKIEEQLNIRSSTLFPMLVSPNTDYHEQFITYQFYY